MTEKAQPVDVICVCTTEGEIRPLRLRVAEAGQTLRVDIDQILRIDKNAHFGSESITFQCSAMVFRHRLNFCLKYCVRSARWFVTSFI